MRPVDGARISVNGRQRLPFPAIKIGTMTLFLGFGRHWLLIDEVCALWQV
jgi:hypothetical protein